MFTDNTTRHVRPGVAVPIPALASVRIAAMDNLLFGAVAWINRLIRQTKPKTPAAVVPMIELTARGDSAYVASYSGDIEGIQEYMEELCNRHSFAVGEINTDYINENVNILRFFYHLPCFDIFDFCSIPGFTKEMTDEERYNDMFPVGDAREIPTRGVEFIVDKIPPNAVVREGHIVAKITVTTDMLRKLSNYKELNQFNGLTYKNGIRGFNQLARFDVDVNLNTFIKTPIHHSNVQVERFVPGDYYEGQDSLRCFVAAPGDFSIGDYAPVRLRSDVGNRMTIKMQGEFSSTRDLIIKDNNVENKMGIYPTHGMIAEVNVRGLPTTLIAFPSSNPYNGILIPFEKGNKHPNDAFSVYLYFYCGSAEPYQDLVWLQSSENPLEFTISNGG